MKKPDIAKQLARRSKVSPAEAADRLDLILNEIVAELRRGLEPHLPGLGKFHQAPDGTVGFVREGSQHD